MEQFTFTQDDLDHLARTALDDAERAGCDCGPEVWLRPVQGLAVHVRLDHGPDCSITDDVWTFIPEP